MCSGCTCLAQVAAGSGGNHGPVVNSVMSTSRGSSALSGEDPSCFGVREPDRGVGGKPKNVLGVSSEALHQLGGLGPRVVGVGLPARIERPGVGARMKLTWDSSNWLRPASTASAIIFLAISRVVGHRLGPLPPGRVGLVHALERAQHVSPAIAIAFPESSRILPKYRSAIGGGTLIRQEIQDFVSAGPLPSEDASEEELAESQRLFEQISPPVSDEEAQLLATAFGQDDCYGGAWALLHLIETAPGAKTAHYDINIENEWVQRLNARVESYRRQ